VAKDEIVGEGECTKAEVDGEGEGTKEGKGGKESSGEKGGSILSPCNGDGGFCIGIPEYSKRGDGGGNEGILMSGLGRWWQEDDACAFDEVRVRLAAVVAASERTIILSRCSIFCGDSAMAGQFRA
jgi:hypothetical protein